MLGSMNEIEGASVSFANACAYFGRKVDPEK